MSWIKDFLKWLLGGSNLDRKVQEKRDQLAAKSIIIFR